VNRSDFVPVSIRICCLSYSLLMALCPSDLRGRFGAEMAQVFADQIWEAWDLGGAVSALRVWRLALWELLARALALRICNTRVLVRLLSMASSNALVFIASLGDRHSLP